MSALFSDAKRRLIYNSGSDTVYFRISEGAYNSFQIAKETTGTLNSVRLEVSNFEDRGLPLTQSNQNWAWHDARLTGSFGSNGQASPPPTYLTASSTPASVGFDVGVVSFRFARVIVTTGFGDYFKFQWHGKD